MEGHDDIEGGEYIRQTRDEVAAHLGPAGPVQAATQWLKALLAERDYRRVWQLTDSAYRRWRAETWVAANASHPLVRSQEPGEIIVELAMVPSPSPMWSAFAETELRQFATAWSDVDLATWGWASRPRPLSPGYEVVLTTPENVGGKFEHPTLVGGLQIVMHHTPDGWLAVGPLDSLTELELD